MITNYLDIRTLDKKGIRKLGTLHLDFGQNGNWEIRLKFVTYWLSVVLILLI